MSCVDVLFLFVFFKLLSTPPLNTLFLPWFIKEQTKSVFKTHPDFGETYLFRPSASVWRAFWICITQSMRNVRHALAQSVAGVVILREKLSMIQKALLLCNAIVRTCSRRTFATIELCICVRQRISVFHPSPVNKTLWLDYCGAVFLSASGYLGRRKLQFMLREAPCCFLCRRMGARLFEPQLWQTRLSADTAGLTSFTVQARVQQASVTDCTLHLLTVWW